MKKSMSKSRYIIGYVLFSAMLFLGFKAGPDMRELLTWSNKILAQDYDPSGDAKLKKWELNITDDYFLRLRKTYQNGKQEYFSCQLHSFTDLDYLGTTAGGLISINTKGDDIIVQTYNDRKGDVDSMATTLTIPVKNMDVEQIDSLRNALIYFKTALPVNGQ
jgi:hypothetical protein